MNEVERKSKSNLKMTKREATPGRENGRQEGLRFHMQVITARSAMIKGDGHRPTLFGGLESLLRV